MNVADLKTTIGPLRGDALVLVWNEKRGGLTKARAEWNEELKALVILPLERLSEGS